MLKKSLFWGMTAILTMASFAFMGCAEAALSSGAKSVLAFSVNGTEGVIDEDAKVISVTLPAGTAVTALAPTVALSKAASVIDPATGEALGEPGDGANQRLLPAADFTNGKSYVVKAEDGSTQVYRVEVTVPPEPPAVVLESISVVASKTSYDYNEAFDIGSLVVTGAYSDGSKKVEAVAAGDITGYDPAKEGRQNVTVTIGGVFAIFQVTVSPEAPEEVKQSFEVAIALPDSAAAEPAVYGIPEGGITLSLYGKTANTPDQALISVTGSNGDKGVWTSITWYIDGTSKGNDNILTIKANDGYTLGQPHAITFVGTKGGVEYSKTIEFTVVK